ncbi:MAG: hypothetical protein HYT72_00065 [Candidatus Aenigmarchaeota archaeon]|nr:hypothetical protein [Candidatus Aenigmarchaeota archaeon]
MLFSPSKDWKQYLTADDEKRMNEVLNKIAKHKGAYRSADDIKISQLWCAVLELAKENAALQKRVQSLEDLLEGMFEKVRKQERERIELTKSLEKF